MGQKIKFSRQHTVSFILVIVMLASQLATENIRAGLPVFICVSIWFIVRNGCTIRLRKLPGFRLLLLMVLLGTVGGVVSLFKQDCTAWQVERDLMRFLVVLLYYFLASEIQKKEENDKIFRTIFLYTGIYSVGSLLISIPRFIQLVSAGSLLNIFSVMRLDEMTVTLGTFLAITGNPNRKRYFFNKVFDNLLRISILMGFVLSFSRTSLALLAVLMVTQIQKSPKKVFKIVAIIATFSIVVYAVAPELFSNYIDKIGRSFMEVSSSKENWTLTEIVQNWRGYEVYCAKRNFLNDFNLWQQMFGKGFGGGVDVYGYSYLVTGESTLAKLHNGYYTMLIKEGIVGFSLQIAFLVSLLVWVLQRAKKDDVCMISVGMTIGMLISTYVIMGPLWGQNCFLVFLMLALCERNF